MVIIILLVFFVVCILVTEIIKMAKRNSVSISKKGLPGLKRVGVGVERHWEFVGKSFKTMRQLYGYLHELNKKEVEKELAEPETNS